MCDNQTKFVKNELYMDVSMETDKKPEFRRYFKNNPKEKEIWG